MEHPQNYDFLSKKYVGFVWIISKSLSPGLVWTSYMEDPSERRWKFAQVGDREGAGARTRESQSPHLMNFSF